MISKLKILSLLIVANIFSTPLFTASLRQRVQSQLTTPPTQQFWSKMAQQHAKFTHAGQVTWSKIRLHPATPIAQKVITGHTAHYFSNPARLKQLDHIIDNVLAKSQEETPKDNVADNNIEIRRFSEKELRKLNIQLVTDPELLYVYNTIKKDLGITEDVPLYIGDEKMNYLALHVANIHHSKLILNGIILSPKILRNPELLIHALTHELGHFLQHSNDPASYQSKYKSGLLFTAKRFNDFDDLKLDSKQMEIGAEANTAGYVDCQDCLYRIQDYAHATDSIAHQLGYFSKPDWQPYIERAIENQWLCPAHQKMRNLPITEKFKHIVNESTPKYPLHAYLPQTYDRSGYSAPDTLD